MRRVMHGKCMHGDTYLRFIEVFKFNLFLFNITEHIITIFINTSLDKQGLMKIHVRSTVFSYAVAPQKL